LGSSSSEIPAFEQPLKINKEARKIKIESDDFLEFIIKTPFFIHVTSNLIVFLKILIVIIIVRIGIRIKCRNPSP